MCKHKKTERRDGRSVRILFDVGGVATAASATASTAGTAGIGITTGAATAAGTAIAARSDGGAGIVVVVDGWP